MKRLPAIVRVIVYLGLCELMVFLAQFVTGFFSFRGPVSTNVLLFVLLLFMTRGILRLEGLGWADAGLTRRPGDLGRFGWGFLTGMAMLVAVALATRAMVGFRWLPNPAFGWAQAVAILVTIFCSAFAQEVAFRGYPFFLMVRKWGQWPAQLVTAILFGCMHLHEGMSWQDVLMVMFSTGIGSLLFGLATLRTGSIWLAAGIHFGWNLLQYMLPRGIGETGNGAWLLEGGRHSGKDLLIYMGPYVLVVGLVYWMINRSKALLPVKK